MKELYVGDRVYVNTDLSLTNNYHGVNEDMQKQSDDNEEVFVLEIRPDGAIMVTGEWLYHRSDLTFMSRDIQPEDEVVEAKRILRERILREELASTFCPLTDLVDVELTRADSGRVIVQPRSVDEQMRDISEEVAGMIEEDDARAIASKARKDIPLYSGCYNYFPLALQEVAKLSKEGNDKHNPGQPLHWNRTPGLSDDHADALARHFVDIGKPDPDMGGITHTASVAWRALALLQEEMEKRDAISKS